MQMQRTRGSAGNVVLVGILLGVFLLPGCRRGRQMGPTVEVTGKVTLDDEPFSEGTIGFTCLRSGATFNARPGSDGTYAVSILDVQLGETYGVFIGGIEYDETEYDEEADAPKAPTDPPVPAKYLEATTSGLTATIDKEEKLTFDFELKSE